MVDPQEILNSLPDAVVCFTPERKVAGLNDAARQLWPQDPGGAASSSAWSSRALQQILDDLPLPIQAGHLWRRHIEVTINGVPAWVQAAVLKREAPSATFFVLSVPDPTNHERTNRRLSTLRKRLMLGALARGLEHEFNNALTTVISALDQALASPALNRELHDGVHRAKTSAQRAAELVQALGTLSGQSRSAPEAVEPRPILDRVALILRRCLDPRLRLEAPMTTGRLWFVRAHPGDLMELLLHSVLNVQECTEETGTLTLLAENVEASSIAQKAGQFVRLSITANFPGLATSGAPQCDACWVREPSSDWTHAFPSLPRLLKEMNASMEVMPQSLGKATLHLYLPRSEALAPPPPATRPVVWPAKAEGRERILLVDDEEMVRMVIRTILTHKGYQVTEGEDGEAAVKKYLEAPGTFDLILIDMNMPRLSGRDALLQIRQRAQGVRAILLSGGVEDPDASGNAGLEGVVFLRKPFDNQELLRTVRACLDSPPRT